MKRNLIKSFAVSAAVIGLLLATGTAADAVMFTVESEYTSTGTPPDSIDVRTKAFFSDTGVTGVGTERVQVEQLEFRFRSRGFGLQVPTIVLAPPDSFGNFPHGTFLAQFTNGAFDFLVSSDQGGGFANGPATIRPPAGPFSPVYIALGTTGMTERIGFTGLARYNLKSTSVTTSGPLNPVPLPAAFWLFAIAVVNLATIGVFRRRRA